MDKVSYIQFNWNSLFELVFQFFILNFDIIKLVIRVLSKTWLPVYNVNFDGDVIFLL